MTAVKIDFAVSIELCGRKIWSYRRYWFLGRRANNIVIHLLVADGK